MATKRLPRLAWKMQFLEGFCPSCERSTALVVFYAGGTMPRKGGAVRIKPMCLSCGAVWELPTVSAKRLAEEEEPRKGAGTSSAKGDEETDP